MTTEQEEVGRVLAKTGTAGSSAIHRAITAADLKSGMWGVFASDHSIHGAPTV